MKRTLVSIVAIAALAAGCGNESNDRGDGSGFSAEVQKNFLRGCEAASGDQTAYCECMLDSAEDAFTESEFASFEQDMLKRGLEGLDPEDRDWMQTSISTCLG